MADETFVWRGRRRYWSPDRVSRWGATPPPVPRRPNVWVSLDTYAAITLFAIAHDMPTSRVLEALLVDFDGPGAASRCVPSSPLA
jgi:hypothetical protein